jgi:hypothetical protein
MAMQLGDQQGAAMIQQIAMQVGGQVALPVAGADFQMPEAEATAGNLTPEEHPFVERARRQSEEATKPQ